MNIKYIVKACRRIGASMEYTIKKLGELAGISTRTLRYYDEIGLLRPCRINSSGYRIYGQNEIDNLQQILFYKELGIELTEIAKIMGSPDFDRLNALKNHLTSLQKRQKQINLLIETVHKTILNEEGAITMSDKEKFEGFKQQLIDENEQKYGEEIREKYGNQTVDESNAKMMNLTKEEYDKMQTLAADIIERLETAVTSKEDPNGETGLAIAAMHKEWLSFSWPQYSAEAHAGLAQMYVDDERFTAYYDKTVTGCAEFLRDAVKAMTGNE